MIETLTAIFVVLSLLALGLISVVVYLVVGRAAPGECPRCGGTRRSVVHDRGGVMSTRCPVCDR